jgi:hypothetical protein
VIPTISEEAEHTRVADLDDERAGAQVDLLPGGRALVRARGHWQRAHAEATLQGLADAIRRTRGTVTVYWDFSEMARYEPVVRKDVTRWLIDHREELDKEHFVLAPESGLVAMGISAASVALSLVGVRVHMTREPSELEQWLASSSS